MQNNPSIRGSLILDASILYLLLDRNRKQHFRTQYFRRLDMLLRCMKRCKLMNLVDGDSMQTIDNVLLQVRNEHDRVASLLARYKGAHKRRGKVEDGTWCLKTDNNNMVKTNRDFQSPFLRNMYILYTSITKDLPEILSRVNHAASALYVELSRGFFVPLCTTALACISRIRILIMNLGRDTFLQLQMTLKLIEAYFLPLEFEAGELEKVTQIQVSEAKYIVETLILQPDLLNQFMELHHNHYNTHMHKRKMNRLSSFCNKSASTISDVQKDPFHETKSDIFENPETTDTLLGEKISSNHTTVDQNDDEKDVCNHNCDRNLELVSLLKTQKTISKKRKEYDETMDKQDHMDKRLKDPDLLSFEMKTEEKKKKKIKKSKKTKKKNDGRNVIDDIFDGF